MPIFNGTPNDDLLALSPTVGVGPDTVNGFDGNDTIDPQSNNDSVDGGAGNDQIMGRSGNDTLFGGIGDDTISGDSPLDAGVDTGNDLIFGGDGNDLIHGGPLSDTMLGGAGDDTMFSDQFADQFIGGDFISANQGFDVVSYTSPLANYAMVAVNAYLHNAALNAGGAFGDTYSGIRGLIGSDFGDVLGASFVASYLNGGLGNDILISGSGADTIIGGAGIDRVAYSGLYYGAGYLPGTTGIYVSLAASSLNTGEAAGDTFSSIEHVSATDADDTLVGDTEANRLIGLDGNDLIEGGAGADTIDGDFGQDTVSYFDAGAAVVNLATGTATDGYGFLDQLSSIEHVNGSNSGDNIRGSTAANLLRGLGGGDTIFGSTGNDTLEGGLGADSLSGGSQDDVLADHHQAPASAGARAAAADYAAEAADTLLGGDADDYLYASGGGDSIDGGANTDRLVMDLSLQLAPVGFDAPADVATSWVISQGGVSAARVRNVEVIDIVGTAGDDRMTSRLAGLDTLDGGAGADTVGGAGGDSLAGGDGVDTLLLLGGSAYINIEGGEMSVDGIGLAGISGFERFVGTDGNDLIVAPTGGATVEGGAGFDVLYNSVGPDSLSGGADADVLYLIGYPDGDTLDGGGGSDTLAFLIGGTNFTPVAANVAAGGASWSVLVGGVAQASIRNVESMVLVGGFGADSLNGSNLTGDSNLNGNGGGDTIRGGRGNDTVHANGGGDSLDGGAGSDLLSMDFADLAGPLAFNTATDTTTNWTFSLGGVVAGRGRGFESLHAVGTAGNDSMLARLPGGDTISGGAGADSIGGAGGDLLVGGDGTDTLRLLGGSAVFDGLAGTASVDGVALAGFSGFERVLGTGGADAMTAGTGGLTLDGGAGVDVLTGGTGFDVLLGGADGDTIQLSGLHNDSVDGGTGTDMLALTLSAEARVVSATVAAGTSSWTIRLDGVSLATARNIEGVSFAGGTASDRFDATNATAASVLDGGQGADTLTGGAGGDTLRGGGATDRLAGGGGDDVLQGDASADTLTGGGGVDTFRWEAVHAAPDTVTDFATLVDRLAFSAVGFKGGLVAGMDVGAANRFVAGPAATQAFGQFLYDVNTGVLSWDRDGTGLSAAAVPIASFGIGTPLAATDIVIF